MGRARGVETRTPSRATGDLIVKPHAPSRRRVWTPDDGVAIGPAVRGGGARPRRAPTRPRALAAWIDAAARALRELERDARAAGVF